MNFKDVPEDLLKSGLAALTPAMEKFAIDLAEKFPADSPFRTTWARSIAAVAADFSRRHAKDSSEVTQEILRLATEFTSKISTVFAVQQSRGGGDQLRSIDKLNEEFLAGAFARLEKADDPVAELTKLKQEFEFRRELMKLVVDTMASDRPAETIETEGPLTQAVRDIRGTLAKKGVR